MRHTSLTVFVTRLPETLAHLSSSERRLLRCQTTNESERPNIGFWMLKHVFETLLFLVLAGDVGGRSTKLLADVTKSTASTTSRSAQAVLACNWQFLMTSLSGLMFPSTMSVAMIATSLTSGLQANVCGCVFLCELHSSGCSGQGTAQPGMFLLGVLCGIAQFGSASLCGIAQFRMFTLVVRFFWRTPSDVRRLGR